MAPERECPSCHRLNRPGARVCEGCGFNLVYNMPAMTKRGHSGDSQTGVFGLALGTIVHPIATMDAFFFHVSDTAMLTRMAIFYLVSLPISGFIGGGWETGTWVQGTFAEALGFAVNVICIVGAGRLLGQSGSIVGTAVILGFIRAVVTFVLGLYVLAIVIDLMPPSLIVILVFLIWNFILNLVALTNIFGCSAMVAFIISLVAGILQMLVTRALGVAT